MKIFQHKTFLSALLILTLGLLLTQCKKEDPSIRNCRVIDGANGKGIANARWFLLRGSEVYYNPDNTSGYTNECGEFTVDRSGYIGVKADKEGYHDLYGGDEGLYTSSDVVVKLYTEAEVLVRVHNDPNLNEYEKIRLWGLYSGTAGGLMVHDNSMTEDVYSYNDDDIGNRNIHMWGEYIQGTDTVIQYHAFWVEPFVFNEFVVTY